MSAADDDADSSALAPRPRPGFKSRAAVDRLDSGRKAQLFAGVLRAGAGCAGLFAALLYLPIEAVTPVLAGVSILMMVTGATSSWRAVSGFPALRRVPLYVAGGCAAVTAVTLLLTVALGAGSLGPLAHLKHPQAAAVDDVPTVSFQPTP